MDRKSRVELSRLGAVIELCEKLGAVKITALQAATLLQFADGPKTLPQVESHMRTNRKATRSRVGSIVHCGLVHTVDSRNGFSLYEPTLKGMKIINALTKL